MVQKIYIKMQSVSCSNIHHDVTVLVNHGIIKNIKTWMSWRWNITFLQNKKILNLCHRCHILKSYRFVAEVTFKLWPFVLWILEVKTWLTVKVQFRALLTKWLILILNAYCRYGHILVSFDFLTGFQLWPLVAYHLIETRINRKWKLDIDVVMDCS